MERVLVESPAAAQVEKRLAYVKGMEVDSAKRESARRSSAMQAARR